MCWRVSVCMLLILQGLQTGVLLAVDQEEVYMGLGHEGSNHLTAPIQTPSSQSNLPLAPQPAQPTATTTSTSTPPPLSATHMHPLFSLLPAVCHSSLSLSLSTLTQSGQISPLFLLSCLHPSTTLSFSSSTATSPSLFTFTSTSWKDLSPPLSQTSSGQRLYFHSWPFLGPSTFYYRRRRLVCVWCVTSPVLCPWGRLCGFWLARRAEKSFFWHNESSAAAPVGPCWPFVRLHKCK